MNHYAAAGFLTFFTSFVLGILVYVRNPKRKVNYLFALFSVSVAVYGLGFYRQTLAASADQEMRAIRLLLGGTIFIPAFYIHTVYTILEKKLSVKSLIIIYIAVAFFEVANFFTTWLAASPVPKLGFKYLFQAGPLYPALMLFFVICVAIALWQLFRGYHAAHGLKRNQLKYIFFSTLIGYGGSSAGFALGYNIDLYPLNPFGNYCGVLYNIVFTYAILKYRLMDITLLARNTVIFLFYFAVTSVIFVPIIILPVLLKGNNLLWLSILFIAALVIIAPFLYQRFIQPRKGGLAQKVTSWIDEKLFQKKFSYFPGLTEFWESKGEVYTSAQLGEILVGGITELMRLESCSFYVFVNHRKVFAPIAYTGLDDIFDREQAVVLNTIYPDDPLAVYLKKNKKIITLEELDDPQDAGEGKATAAQMDGIKASLSAPLLVNRRLTGILNLGPKKNRDMFNDRDLKIIRELTQIAEYHFSHASFLENSLFYSTGVAHDLRKPFKNGRIFQHLAEARTGRPRALDDLEAQLNNIYEMSERMINLSENLDRFLKGEFKPEAIDGYIKMVKEICRPHQAKAEEKGLEFAIEAPAQTSGIYAEIDSARRILDELLTNAVKYTAQGKITVTVYQENPHEVITEVADTGCGIAEENKDDIWELFRRHDTAGKTEGSGIGLACAWQLAEANAGRIFLKYSEPGKGSSFCLALPATP